MYLSQMEQFRQFSQNHTKRQLSTWTELHRWSVDAPQEFWPLLANFCGVKWLTPYTEAFTAPPPNRILGARWFTGGQLNFGQNLLSLQSRTPYSETKTRLVEVTESKTTNWSQSQVEALTAKYQELLGSYSLPPDARICAITKNDAHAICLMLASSGLGFTYSSCSPDFGLGGLQDRLSELQPHCVFFATSYQYNGRIWKLDSIIKQLKESLPGSISFVPFIEFDTESHQKQNTPSPKEAISYLPTPFDHPLYTLFSSGTTGKPKCIIHGSGATLLQHKKELMLHCDLKVDDSLLFFTTAGWMMWNWMASALAVGSQLVLYDGSPMYPQADSLWKLVSKEKVSVVGTSPKFLSACIKKGVDLSKHDLSRLRLILCTGSPLMPEHVHWLKKQIRPDIRVNSISGGTDIISCFVLGHPTLRDIPGRIQCAGLGMSVSVRSQDYQRLIGQKGELVCDKPFVSMPLGFKNDPDGSRYHKAYFEYYPEREVWRHGDLISEEESGGYIIYGRSDATLNPGGIRIGTAEIYRQVERIEGIVDSVAVSLNRNGESQIVLCVKTHPGLSLDKDMVSQLKERIKNELTPRHVPQFVFPVSDIPYTLSGKKMEILVGDILNQRPSQEGSGMSNPDCLPELRDLAKRLAAE